MSVTTCLVTGGASFIGSAVVRHFIRQTSHSVVNLNKLTYAGNLHSLADVANSDRYHFVQADICDVTAVAGIFARFQPEFVMQLAAESHVDRSIAGPADFIHTNIVETYNIGGHNERPNIEVVYRLCALLEELALQKPASILYYTDLITFATDRQGHEVRYAIDASKIQAELGWTPTESFERSLRKTVQWYLEHPHWWQAILDCSYQQYDKVKN